MIDTEDLERLINIGYMWSPSFADCTQSYYAHTKINLGYFDGKPKYRKLSLQCFLTEIDSKTGYKVDHINHNTLDNRKCNLRIVEQNENLKNRKGKNKNNSTGYRNVSWVNSEKTYVVQLQIDGKNTRLGKFKDVHEAGEFAKKMREKYYGEFAGKD